jgi:hypothetical protein
MKFTGWFSILVGLLMLAQWGFFLATGQVPETQSEPIRLAFHLVAEAGTALALLISGVALLQKRDWARRCAFIALGMLIYTVIVSPGYFAQQGQWPLVGMFAILLALDLVCIRQLSRPERSVPVRGMGKPGHQPVRYDHR